MNIVRRITKNHRRFDTGKRLQSRPSTGNEMSTLETLKFDNLVLRRLPIDEEERNYVRAVRNACFSKVNPTPVEKPVTVAYSSSAMALLDLPISELERKEFAEYFSGNRLLPGSEPAAHCYCGHQFGHFTGQLGDGAAMYLGEVINSKGERWEIQLKGAGLTPYSRTADGRKVMRSSIREFLCSEAMHFLNVPTTRAGSCSTSDTEVIRDIFYNGNPIEEKCTIVLRIAPTFLRFGSFEIFKTMDSITMRCGPSVGRTDILHQLLDYTIETFFPQVHQNPQKYAKFFEEVVLLTARLVAEWQCVGFCHGVLNTDNMSIAGLTIDYGPFGFMDMYNPDHVCNASDESGRYSYTRQPEMCFWNLKKLAEAIEKALPLSVSSKALELFEPEFNSHYLSKMRCKLGILKQLPEDSSLIEALFDTMEKTGSDFTKTFRCMSLLSVPGMEDHESSLEQLKQNLVENCCYPLETVIQNIKSDMSSSNIQLLLALARTSPELANHLSSSGFDLDRVKTKMELVGKLSEMSPDEKKAYDYRLWNEWLEMYSARLAKEYEDESLTPEEFQKKKIGVMNQSNPRFILRNYILQNAITKAERGDYAEVRKILKQLENPFSDLVDVDNCSKPSSSSEEKVHETSTSFTEQVSHMDSLSPEWAFRLRVT